MTKKTGKIFEISENDHVDIPGENFGGAKLKFPCDYAVSVMGIRSDTYMDDVFVILKKHISTLERDTLTLGGKSDSKYCSVRAKFVAENQEQIDALYEELAAQPFVKWVL